MALASGCKSARKDGSVYHGKEAGRNPGLNKFCLPKSQIKRIQLYSQKSQSLNHCDPNLDQLLLMQLELLSHPTVQYIKNINSVCVKALCFITKNILPISIGWRPNPLATATTIIISLNSGNEEDLFAFVLYACSVGVCETFPLSTLASNDRYISKLR
ncbi:hypothetical protein P5673_017015 [Acropora cervicornis]|uniref:Uncharacterized protein n=1 Tax=Acropora cervicornis TaxID=6130 RepID=A0AAD9QF01_ACRCE|nr:hypothetical protein P5673_017015 [Acropora cervicornis]